MRRFTFQIPSAILLIAMMFHPLRVRGQGTTTTPSLSDMLNFINEQPGGVSLSSRYQIQGTGDSAPSPTTGTPVGISCNGTGSAGLNCVLGAQSKLESSRATGGKQP